MKRIYAKYKSTIISFIAFTLILITTQSLNARNYYFSTSAGDDNRTSTQAQNPATPWKSISKLNSFFISLAAGDSVLFKRGETFYGSIRVVKSGTSSLPIVIGAYGAGTTPTITGFTSISSWTSLGNGVYQSAVTNSKSTLNIVTVNSKNTPMGRFPNTGFLSFESHSGNTSITDNQLSGTPNWTGSEVIIRKAKYAIGRNLISNHSNTVISYLGGGDAPIDNFGYFIQNDLKTLDIFGEWYLNPSTKRLHIYTGATNPSSYSIRASSLDTLVYSSYQSYVTITNLNFEGANYSAFYIRGGQNVSILGCGIDFSGKYGVNASGNTGFKLENCSINHSNHNSVQLFCSNALVRNNKIKNTGVIPGMAENGEGGNGIELLGGDGTFVEFNEIDSVAGHGIFIRGNNVTLQNNLINHFAILLDDVGGIYTYGKFSGRKIIGNIVLNGIGSISGTTSTIAGVKGIMMEVFSAFVEIRDNTVANAGVSGIHLNSSHDLIIRNNLIYNNRYQILAQNSATDPAEYTRNISMYKNIFFSKTSTQNVMYMYSIRTDIPLFGTADSNYYCRPLDDNYTFLNIAASVQTSRNLAGWQSYTGKDSHSKKSPQTLTSENDILFDYNASLVNKVIPLNAVYLGVDGTVYTSSYTLLPYRSVILIKSANQTIGTNLPPFIQNQGFQVNKNTTNGTIVGTVIASDPNVGQVLTYSIVSGNTNSAFSINSSTGVLSVANSTEISTQTLSSYSLVVRVQDNGTGLLSSQATITISLTTTVNQPPVINNQSFSVAQNQANGTSVGTVIATDPDVTQTKTFLIVSGNTNGAFAINSSTGVLTVANSTALNFSVTPSFALIVRVQDNGTGLLSSQATITINVVTVTTGCSATGNISYQVWNNIGTSVTVSSLTSNINYPNNPSSTTLITSMEGTTNLADGYGARIAGYICAPSTGSYTFWIASDDYGELWLSTDAQPANKQRIAYHNGFTWIREWNKYPTQKSVAINLIQGQSYYIEALMKDASGIDNFAVGWLKPGQSGTVPSEIVPGSVLSPLLNNKSEEVSINNITLSKPETKIFVYPNPLSNEELKIKIENLSSKATLKIFTITGVECTTQIVQNSGTIPIDRSVFTRGMYIVKIFNEDFVESIKLIVN
jgi:parallel beta-helix repeat protein